MKKEMQKNPDLGDWRTIYLSAKNACCSVLSKDQGSVPARMLGGSQLQEICSVLASVGTAHTCPRPHLHKRLQNSGQQTHTIGFQPYIKT